MLLGDRDPHGLKPELFFTPAYRELALRGLKLPRLAAEAALLFTRFPTPRAIGEALGLLAQALPVGIFDNDPMRRYLAKLFSEPGRTDDFRELRHPLTVVAADLCAGKPIRFGDTGLDHIPISLAVQASTAVPGVYPPVTIEGRDCVDGVLLKTVHASVALEHGAELLFCINPIVPVDLSAGAESGAVPEHVLVQLGLPAVLSQTFRTLIHSRLRLGISRYSSRFPDADVVLLEPRADEYAMFFSNIFSFRTRRLICERGYAATRRDLLGRFNELSPVLRGHGYTLLPDVLLDETRDLWRGAGLDPAMHAAAKSDRLSAIIALDRNLARMERAAGVVAPRAARRTHPPARGRRHG